MSTLSLQRRLAIIQWIVMTCLLRRGQGDRLFGEDTEDANCKTLGESWAIGAGDSDDIPSISSVCSVLAYSVFRASDFLARCDPPLFRDTNGVGQRKAYMPTRVISKQGKKMRPNRDLGKLRLAGALSMCGQFLDGTLDPLFVNDSKGQWLVDPDLLLVIFNLAVC